MNSFAAEKGGMNQGIYVHVSKDKNNKIKIKFLKEINLKTAMSENHQQVAHRAFPTMVLV
jgi:hypothetical protein